MIRTTVAILIAAISCLIQISPVLATNTSWPSLYQNQENTNRSNDQPMLPLSLNYSVANQYIKPVIDQNILITARSTGTIRYITAYNATTGQTLWNFSLGSSFPRQPLIHQGRVYFGLSSSAKIYTLNLETGELIWSHTITNERLTRYAPVIIDDALYIVGDKLHKLSLQGNYIWNRSYDISSPLAVEKKQIYLRIHGQELIRYDTVTDAEVWRYHTNTTTGTQPVVVGETVYIGLSQRIAAIDQNTGYERWHYDFPSNRPKIGSISATPAYVLVGTNNGDILRFSPTGELVWRNQFNTGDYQGNGWLAEFQIAGNYIFTRLNQNNILVLDATSGQALFSDPLSIAALVPAAIAQPHIYFTKDTSLYSYSAASWSLEPIVTPPPDQPGKRLPVIIVPGIMESWPVFGVWKIDPIFGIFRNLFTALKTAGYEEGTTLIPFAYDWHKSNTDTAKDLQQTIQDIKQRTGSSQVDIVAHSMGGLVARTYIQGPTYANDVHTLIAVATPNHGSPKAYLTWEAGEVGSTVLDTIAEKLIAYEARKAGYFDKTVAYIQAMVPALRELLPIYDYLQRGSDLLSYVPCNLVLHPCNPFLEQLEDSLTLLTDRTNYLNIIAALPEFTTLQKLSIIPYSLSSLWQHGIPINYPKLDSSGLGIGDTTVPLSSAKLSGAKEVNVEADHTSAVSKAIPAILTELIGETAPSPITEWVAPKRALFLEVKKISSFSILNTPSETQQLRIAAAQESEIFTLQEGDTGLAIITNPEPTYQINLVGREKDTSISISLIEDNATIDRLIIPTTDSAEIILNQITASPESTPTSSISPTPSYTVLPSTITPISTSSESSPDSQPTPHTSLPTIPSALPSPNIPYTTLTVTPKPNLQVSPTSFSPKVSSSTPQTTIQPTTVASPLVKGVTTATSSTASSKPFYAKLLFTLFITTVALSLIYSYLHYKDLP
jgi:outer membrane protein assembly factor BamB